MRSLLPRLLLALIVLGTLTACGQPAAVPSQPTAAPQATTAPAATVVPAATATAAPSATTPATATSAPTATIAATATTAATATIAPSPTTPAPAADESNAPQGQGALDLLVQSGKAQLDQNAFRATLTTTDAGGKETTVVLEYVKPNSFHIASPEQEIIIVKDGTFIKQGAAPWQKSPVDMQSMMSDILSQQGIEAMIKDVKYQDIKLVGVDVIGGKPMWVYQYKSTLDAGGTQVSAESKNWIGVLDKLPYRVEAVSDAGSGAKYTVTGVYEYGDNIKIEAPAVTG